METAALISKRPSYLLWSEIEKWAPTSNLLRFGKLPAGWRLLPVAKFAAQLDNKEKVQPEAEYRMAGVKWYGEGVFHRETVLGKTQSAKYLYPLKPGTIIYNRLFAWKESFAIVPGELDGLYVSNEFPQFEIDTAVALPEYVYLLFISKKIISAVNAASVGSAAISRNRFKESDFLGFKIPIPPLSVQQKVVAYWEATLNYREKFLEKKPNLLKCCHDFLLNSLGIEKTEPKPKGKMFRLPWRKAERWSYEYNKRVLSGLSTVLTGRYPAKTLGQLCSGQSGSTPSKKNPFYWRDGKVPWISPKDMKTREIYGSIDQITEKAIQDRQAPIVSSGSVLFVVRSGILQKIVPVAVTKETVSINQDIRAFRPRTGELLPDFLLAYLQSKQDDLLRLVKWSTTVQSINKEELESFPVPLPPVDIQQKIVSEVTKYQDAVKRSEEDGERTIESARMQIEQMILGTRPVEVN